MAAGTSYSKRYAGGFVDKPSTASPIDQTFLNAVETALLQLIGQAPSADGQVAQWDFANTRFGPALLLNKNVDPAAAIASSKIDFTGGNALTNAAIAGAAAIARSKLDFGSGLVNADISAAAAIAASKLASYPADATKALLGDGSWGAGQSNTFGRMILIDEQVGTGASGTITFNTGITSAYRHLRVEWTGSTSAAAGATLFRFRMNNISGANDYLTNWSDTSTEYGTGGIVGYCSGTTGGANRTSGGFIDFPYIQRTTTKAWVAQYATKINTTGTPGNDLKFAQGGGFYLVNSANAAVTRLDFILNAGNWTADTTFSLYGIV